MRAPTFLYLLLLSATAMVAAGDSGFPLGLDYSQWLLPNVNKLATDASGAIYLLSNAVVSGQSNPPSTVTKLSADGKTMLWQNQLGISVSTMAVDPNGGVYVSPMNSNALSVALNPGVLVAKLNDGGSGIAWTMSTGVMFPNGALPTLAADAAGRVYVGGLGTFLRVAANGASVDYKQPLVGLMTSIAVDATGAAFVAGGYISDGILARFAPDGTPSFYTTFPDSQVAPTIALDVNGNAVVYSRGTLSRFDASGKITSSKRIMLLENSYSVMGMDQAGDAYLLGTTRGTYYPAKNSLAACGTEFLTVIAPDGSVLQTTYLPGATASLSPLITVGKNGNVLIAAAPASTFVPTRTGPVPNGQASTTSFLLSLSPSAIADTFPLACIGNGATFAIQAISPGQLLTLFGNGLGPQQGVEPPATLQTPYPMQAGNVEVTFDGTRAPILWTQDSQVNVVTPWSLNTTKDTEVCVSSNGMKLKCLSWATAQTVPSVFTAYNDTSSLPGNTFNSRYAIALNQDGSINSASNPAQAGSLVSVFATGLGAISPAQADGSLIDLPLPANSIPVTVEAIFDFISPHGGTISYTPVDLSYAGPAPYRVAGISQINFRVSGSSSSGGYRLKLPNGTSQAFVVHEH